VLAVELAPPTLEDNISDLSRLLRSLKLKYNLSNLSVDFDVVKKLARVLRRGKWRVVKIKSQSFLRNHDPYSDKFSVATPFIYQCHCWTNYNWQ